MKKYIVFNNATGEKIDYICRVVNNEKFCCWLTTNMPEVSDIQKVEYQEIDNSKRAKIINCRKPGLKPFLSLSVAQPDYQPIDYLLRGIRSANAVCLLKKEFELQKLCELIKDRSINAYPQVLRDIATTLDIDSNFWYEYKTIYQALENSKFKEKLEEHPSKLICTALGTGFLVGKNYLLTNHHVLSSKDEAEKVIAQFRYEYNNNTSKLPPVDYHLDTSFFVPNKNKTLDYTLVKLKPLDSKEGNKVSYLEAGNNFGWLPMQDEEKLVSPPLNLEESDEKSIDYIINDLKKSLEQKKELLEQEKESISPEEQKRRTREINNTEREINNTERWINNIKTLGLLGEPVNIIQHPRGREKEIVLYNNKVQELYDNFLQYETDADFGSSGSPILNVNWQLVGLHHGMLVSVEENTNTDDGSFKVEGNLGIRIHSIVQDLGNQKENNIEIKQFLDDYVGEGRKRRIFISAGRERKDVFGKSKISKDTDVKCADFEKKRMKFLGIKVKEKLEEIESKSKESDFEVYLYNKGNLDEIIKKINDKNNETKDDGYLTGDLALELLTDFYEEKPGVRGASAYYVSLESYRYERKIHAEILLQSLVETLEKELKIPELILPSRGVRSDDAVKRSGLRFCRKIAMPSLVLYMGYITNKQDRKLMSEHVDKLASGIAEGIKRWSYNLRPSIHD